MGSKASMYLKITWPKQPMLLNVMGLCRGVQSWIGVPSAVGRPPLWASAKGSISPDSERFTLVAAENREKERVSGFSLTWSWIVCLQIIGKCWKISWLKISSCSHNLKLMLNFFWGRRFDKIERQFLPFPLRFHLCNSRQTWTIIQHEIAQAIFFST